jgi:hypothetical protein
MSGKVVIIILFEALNEKVIITVITA